MQGSPAEIRNAAAKRLMARRRYRQALDVLNDAIRIEPRYAESYANRAEVFEELGMYPQAEADRRKAADLAGLLIPEPEAEAGPPVDVWAEAEPAPLTESEPEATEVDSAAEIPSGPVPARAGEEAETEPARPAGRPRADAVPRHMAPSPRVGGDQGAAALAKVVGTTLISIGLLAAAAAGIYIGFNSITDALDAGNGGDSSDGGATVSPTPSGGPTPTATEEAPDDALSGSPLSFSRLGAAWKGKGITAEPGGENEDVDGFKEIPVNVTLTRGSDTMEVVVLLYDAPQEIGQDWDLGEQAKPKPGRSIPSGATVWYNLNAVVIIIESNDALRADARDAFFALSA